MKLSSLQLKGLKVGGPAMLGFIIFGASSIAMWVFQIYWFLEWWSLLGLLAGLFIPILATLFPLIYWMQEGFPTLYLLIWLLGIGSLSLGIAASQFLVKKEIGKTKQNFANAFSQRGKSQRSKYRDEDVIDAEVVED